VNAPISISFDVAEEDIDAFHNHFVLTSPFGARLVRRRQLRSSALSVLLIGVGIWLLATESDATLRTYGMISLAYGAGYLVYLLAWYPARFKKNWLNNIHEMSNDHPVTNQFGRVTCSIDGDRLISVTPLGDSNRPLSDLPDIQTTSQHVFIYVDGQNAIVVPKNKIVSGDLDAFMHALENSTKV